ncbi:phosphoadenosine phosphosulfate reductase family protein [Paraclostridium tenue]|uniref:Phosphoadenosine phosphosulphate reductase domain-containing protein n=1 Tax=Paraclostridium tenue TaxID=1737 RepID=A0ABN1M9H3_9FIRM
MLKDILKIRQAYPLWMKEAITKNRINLAIDLYGREGLYVSFSGGKDSTVLHYLVAEVELERFGDIKIPRVFVDTGLEFPELKEFVYELKKELGDILIILRPPMNFRQVLDKYGYPLISKSQAMAIRKLTTQNLSIKYRNKLLYGDEKGTAGKLSNKWHYLLDGKIKISEQCCDVMKKRPFHKYEKTTGRVPITGVMANESNNRTIRYVKDGGCNAFNNKRPQSKPLSVWLTTDILEYLKIHKKRYCEVYGDITEKDGILVTTGEQRTGCIFCGFGVTLEKGENRFQRLKRTHPQLHSYCMDHLGMKEVLDYIGVESE